jgi:hypothetical protein
MEAQWSIVFAARSLKILSFSFSSLASTCYCDILQGTTVWDLLKLIAYFPFGVGLFVVRLNLLFLLLGLLAFSNTFHVTRA